MRRLLIVLLATTLANIPARAENIRGLLEEAFDSPTGSVLAPLDGQMADMIRQAAPIKGYVLAEIKTVKRFKEPDCRRFEVKLKATAADTVGQSSANLPLPIFQVNYCKGGGYPKEGEDPEAAKRFERQIDDYAKSRGIARTKANQPE